VTRLVRLCVALLGVLAGRSPATAQAPLRVAAASDLQAVLPALTARFQKQTGGAVDLSFGSSGNFFAQLQNGAPFDVFFSADVDYPKRLESSGLTVAGTLVEYASGRIVLWTRSDSGLNPASGLSILADARVRRVAIASPDHAPYGRAAVAALKHERLYDRVRPKFVLGENISQAAQFAQSGNADAGVIALSVALGPAMRAAGRYVEIPASFYPPIVQAAVVLRSSRNQELARQLLSFIQRPDSRRALQDAGFIVPGGDR
jgi:molybdate transport system substrate-binding protein